MLVVFLDSLGSNERIIAQIHSIQKKKESFAFLCFLKVEVPNFSERKEKMSLHNFLYNFLVWLVYPIRIFLLTIFLNAWLRLQLIHPIGSKMPIKSGIRYKWIPQSGKDPMLSWVARRSQIRVFIFWVTTVLFGFAAADSDPNGRGRQSLQETQPKFIILRARENTKQIT